MDYTLPNLLWQGNLEPQSSAIFYMGSMLSRNLRSKTIYILSAIILADGIGAQITNI